MSREVVRLPSRAPAGRPDVPLIAPGRLVGHEREVAREKVAAAYGAGYSVASIISATGRGMNLIYRLLDEAGEPLREPRKCTLGIPRTENKKGVKFPSPPPRGAPNWMPLMIDVDTVRVDDLVLIRGQTRAVRDLRTTGVDKVLHLDRGGSYRLKLCEELPARRQETMRSRR